MKVKLIYFSGTGNTERIAGLYADCFAARGYEVLAVKLPANDDELDISDCDILGVGYPIHAFNAPQTVLRAAKKFVKCADKPQRVFVFKTSGEPVRMSDVSSLKLRGILERRGLTVTGEYQYVMPYNIIFRHGDGAVDRMWTTAKRLVPVDADEIISGKSRLPEKIFMGGFLAWGLRCEHWGAHILGKAFKATDACVGCGLCEKDCPAHNIRTDKNGKIKFGAKCMLCMRCVQNCPAEAIKTGLLNGWRVTGKYSFAPPAEPDPPSKHDAYCKKAYDRYYADAENRIEGKE